MIFSEEKENCEKRRKSLCFLLTFQIRPSGLGTRKSNSGSLLQNWWFNFTVCFRVIFVVDGRNFVHKRRNKLPAAEVVCNFCVNRLLRQKYNFQKICEGHFCWKADCKNVKKGAEFLIECFLDLFCFWQKISHFWGFSSY